MSLWGVVPLGLLKLWPMSMTILLIVDCLCPSGGEFFGLAVSARFGWYYARISRRMMQQARHNRTTTGTTSFQRAVQYASQSYSTEPISAKQERREVLDHRDDNKNQDRETRRTGKWKVTLHRHHDQSKTAFQKSLRLQPQSFLWKWVLQWKNCRHCYFFCHCIWIWFYNIPSSRVVVAGRKT